MSRWMPLRRASPTMSGPGSAARPTLSSTVWPTSTPCHRRCRCYVAPARCWWWECRRETSGSRCHWCRTGNCGSRVVPTTPRRTSSPRSGLWHVAKAKPSPARPDYLVFDLDPGPETSIVECCKVARWISERLGDEMVFPKTSGSKGLQLYSPVRRTSWEIANQRAHELAQAIEKDHGDSVVTMMRKNLRTGKVLIDWSQNSPAKTTVAAYSLRARPSPTVSTPVTWKEVDACAKSGKATDLRFTSDDVLKRVEKLGDIMEPLIARNKSGRQTR